MKITDEMVETVCQFVYSAWHHEYDSVKRHGRATVRNALEVAFKTPQGFCTKATNCRLTDGHEGGCVR